MEIVRVTIGTLLFAVGLAAYAEKYAMPDPHVVCAAHEMPITQEQCREIVSFALASGW
jgi:hypothetical protein